MERDYQPFFNQDGRDKYPSKLFPPSILAMMKEGDELWRFDTPQEYWDALCGRRGFFLVRDGKVIETFEYCMS